MSVTFYPNLIQYAGFDAAAEPSNAGETYTCSGGETSGPLYDLLDNRRTNICTWDTNGESVVTTARIDVSSSITNDFCIIDNHNLNSCDVNIDIEQGGSEVSINSSYSGTLGSELSADSSISVPDADGVSLFLTIGASDTQWEIEMTPDTANFTADIYIGEICLGTSFAPDFNPELQPTFGYDLPGSSYRESEGGQRYGFSTHTNERRAWHFQWKYMSDADKSLLEDIFLFTGGVKFPFYIDLGPILGATNPQLFYVRFMRPLSFKGITKDAWQVDIYIEEEI